MSKDKGGKNVKKAPGTDSRKTLSDRSLTRGDISFWFAGEDTTKNAK